MRLALSVLGPVPTRVGVGTGDRRPSVAHTRLLAHVDTGVVVVRHGGAQGRVARSVALVGPLRRTLGIHPECKERKEKQVRRGAPEKTGARETKER